MVFPSLDQHQKWRVETTLRRFDRGVFIAKHMGIGHSDRRDALGPRAFNHRDLPPIMKSTENPGFAGVISTPENRDKEGAWK
jgi:hypothetical protein